MRALVNNRLTRNIGCMGGTGRVVVLGSINMDLVVRVDELPRAGETVLGDRLRTIPGGKGANQAVAAARLGGRVHMIGRVGGDAFGRRLIDGLRSDRVDVEGVTVDETEPTGAALIVVDRRSENIITVAPGANGAVGEADVERVRKVLTSDDVLVMQLEIPYPAVLAAIDVAREARARVVLNAAPVDRVAGRAIPNVDLLIANEGEAEALGGDALRRSVGALAVTLGAKGSILYEGRRATEVKPHRVTAVDATAAGDAFVGAAAFALAEGAGLEAAMRLGNAAGAATVTKMGAQTSLPTKWDLKRLFDIELNDAVSPAR